MFAGVLIEIDQLCRRLDRVERGAFHGFRPADEGKHRAVVIDVGMLIEEGDTLDRRDSRSDFGDDFGPPRFAEVGNTFDNLGHRLILAGEGVYCTAGDVDGTPCRAREQSPCAAGCEVWYGYPPKLFLAAPKRHYIPELSRPANWSAKASMFNVVVGPPRISSATACQYHV
jgi:hypothetical protein